MSVEAERISIAIVPTQSGTLTYDGTAKTASFNDFDSDQLTVTGNTATNAGSHTATFTPKSGYKWSDGTLTGKDVTWTIGKATLPIPSQSGSLTYNTATQTASFSNKDLTKMSVTGDSGVNAGTYTAVFSLLDSNNYQWAGATVSDQSVLWVIVVKTVTAPSVTVGTYTYNGSPQGPTIGTYSSTEIIATHASETDAGDYVLTLALTSGTNYVWSDGTTADKTWSWSIAKAAGALTLSKNSVTLNSSTLSDTITVSNATGEVTASSSDTNVATISKSGNIFTISHVNRASGSAVITFSVASSTNYNAASATASVAAQFTMIYGAEWDGTSTTAWTRTNAAASFTDPVPYVSGASNYGSPFDDISPWKDMTTIEDSAAGTLVKIPKFYYKLTQNGNAIKVQIADGPADGFSVSPAHMDRGDGKGERDLIYVGRYHCGATAYKSASGQKPKASITRATARSSIAALGTGIYQMDFATRFTIWLLYIVEFADWNSQAKIGKGCGDGSATGNMGYTDSMPYHTGTTQNSRDTFGLGTQYRNIEGLWDNVRDWCDGCYYNSSGLNIILNPGDFSDSTGGSVAGLPTSGYPSKFTVSSAGGYPVFYPTESNGSDSTVSCDYWNFNASSPCLIVGGSYSQNAFNGLFYVYYYSATNTYASIGCRLLKLP